jgi:hypothetical protein
MSEEKVPYQLSDPSTGLTFYALVNDLKKLRAEEEQLQEQLKEMARIYPGLARKTPFGEIRAKTTMILVDFDDLIRAYEQKNKDAERAEGEENASPPGDDHESIEGWIQEQDEQEYRQAAGEGE